MSIVSAPLLSDDLSSIGDFVRTLEVQLSNELVQLLSEQLYRSPLKAVEELVVNSFDAEAKNCHIYVPIPSDIINQFIVVFDDGLGMDAEGLVNLWLIGRSNKRTDEVIKRSKRQQIGKFGIGKLATYTIANRVTYVSRCNNVVLAVTLDFNSFTRKSGNDPVELEVRIIKDWSSFYNQPIFREACTLAGIPGDELATNKYPSWTFAILEDLKSKAKNIRQGRLKWILSTAMPLQEEFKLYLNKENISRTKESFDPITEWDITELPTKRIENLEKSTGETWKVKDGQLFSVSFSSGVSGKVLITRQSLLGKSTDLARSHGFFVRVRDRLVNLDDPYFGVTQSSYETFVRFRATIQADDLDNVITAPREGVEDAQISDHFVKLLSEIFYETRDRYETAKKKAFSSEDSKNEAKRNFVDPNLVERPVADVLAAGLVDQDITAHKGAEADDTWFYLATPESVKVADLIASLYSSRPSKYKYVYSGRGRLSRIVRFDPMTSTFVINSDHEFIQHHDDDGRSKVLLEDLVTAEALLEVYLREHQVHVSVIGEILERRDVLFRSLAKDHPFSLKAIASALRDAANNKYDLEVELVAAARALGFVATHIAGSGKPDGVARYTDYPTGEQTIILEAKSSKEVPSLGAIDFAGLAQHANDYKAQGCLLIAPDYPGAGEDSASAKRAEMLKISCWTIEQLARVVEAAASRHFTAHRVLDIVLNHYAPKQVAAAVDDLFKEPHWDIRRLYEAIVVALRKLNRRLRDAPRTVSLVAGEVSSASEFEDITLQEVQEAVSQLASASQGLLSLSGDRIIILGSFEELERRLSGVTGKAGEPRRPSNFRDESK